MKYVAEFEIPDGFKYGCAIVKICPDDNKLRCDADFQTAAATLVRADDYNAPRFLEIPFYRQLVLDHMECACNILKERLEKLKDPQAVWEETVRISKARTQKEIQARYAYYYGQLAILDYIQKMQNEYTVPQSKYKGSKTSGGAE